MSRPLYCPCCLKGVALRTTTVRKYNQKLEQDTGRWTCLNCKYETNDAGMEKCVRLESNLRHEFIRLKEEEKYDRLHSFIDRIDNELPELHSLVLECYEFAHAFFKEICETSPNERKLWIIPAQYLLKLITGREILLALYDGKMNPGEIWIVGQSIKKSKWRNVIDRNRTVREVINCGMEFLDAGQDKMATQMFRDYYPFICHYLPKKSPELEKIRKVLKE